MLPCELPALDARTSGPKNRGNCARFGRRRWQCAVRPTTCSVCRGKTGTGESQRTQGTCASEPASTHVMRQILMCSPTQSRRESAVENGRPVLEADRRNTSSTALTLEHTSITHDLRCYSCGSGAVLDTSSSDLPRSSLTGGRLCSDALTLVRASRLSLASRVSADHSVRKSGETPSDCALPFSQLRSVHRERRRNVTAQH